MLEEKVLHDPELAPYHSKDGPLKVSQPIWTGNEREKMDTTLELMSELGLKTIVDYNVNQQGASEAYFTNSKPQSVRYSTAEAFLLPVKDRENLSILKDAFAKKIIIENKQAVGIEVSIGGTTKKFYANKEVIVSAGAINSIKLLAASGIGAADDLADLNIDVVADLPAGHNMADHAIIPIFFAGRGDLQTNIATRAETANINSVPFPCAQGFTSTVGEEQPNFQVLGIPFGVSSPTLFSSCSGSLDLNEDTCKAITEANLVREIFLIDITLLHPKSLGKVKVTSLEENVNPEIDLQYFTDAEGDDLNKFRDIFKRMLKLVETDYFKEAGGYVVDLGLPECGPMDMTSDEYIDCYMKSTINSVWHPMGTTAMGKVVDNRLRVLGVNSLRVVGPSIMPTSVSGNTNAPTIMIGERAADFIKKDYNYKYNCEL